MRNSLTENYESIALIGNSPYDIKFMHYLLESQGVKGIYDSNFELLAKAYLKLNGETRLRKQFDDIDDAIRARLQAEQDYFGEFAPQRHLFEQYNIKTIQND